MDAKQKLDILNDALDDIADLAGCETPPPDALDRIYRLAIAALDETQDIEPNHWKPN